MVPAKGIPVGKIFSLDDSTSVVPFSWEQLNVIKNALEARAQKLVSSGDYPEQEKDDMILHNIKTAMSLIKRM